MFTYQDYYHMVSILLDGKRMVFFRHDIDISLDKALQLAEKENMMDINSTYFILTSSKYYNPFSKESKRKIEQIIDMGHNIGLHYDLSLVKNDVLEQTKYILWHRSMLEQEFDIEVNTCSVHKPVAQGVGFSRELASMLQISGLHDVNITMPNYKYISDSGMNWREDYNVIVKQYERIHVNTHPEWYDDMEGNFEDRLRSLRLELKTDKLINDEINSINDYRANLKKCDSGKEL